MERVGARAGMLGRRGNHVTALKPPCVAALAGLLAEDRRPSG
jgi:hypothetical protein